MTYNLTSIATNSTSPVAFIQGINNVLMGGWLGVLILVSLLFVILTSYIFVTGDSAKSLAATSFIGFVLALLLRAISLISDTVLFTVVVLAGITIVFVVKKN